MGMSRCLIGCSIFGVVLLLLPLTGIVGLIFCEQERMNWESVYFTFCKPVSLTWAKVSLSMLIINFISIITVFPCYRAAKWVVFFNAVIFFISGLVAMIATTKRVIENTTSGCEKLGLRMSDSVILRLSSTLASSTDMDILQLRYLTGANGAKGLVSASQQWATDKCRGERSTFVMYYAFAMILYVPLIGIPLLVLASLLCGSTSYHRH